MLVRETARDPGFGRPALKMLDFKLLSNKRTKLLASRRLLPTTFLPPSVPDPVAVDPTVPMGPWNLPPSCRWLTQEPGQRTQPDGAFQSMRASKPVGVTTPTATPAPVMFGPGNLPPSCRYLMQPPSQPSVCWRRGVTLSTMRAGQRVPAPPSMPSQHHGFVKGPSAKG